MRATPEVVNRGRDHSLHGDHFGGLPFLFLDGQFSRRTRPLAVPRPVGIRDRLRGAMEELYPGSAAVQRRVEVQVEELVAPGISQSADPMHVSSWQAGE